MIFSVREKLAVGTLLLQMKYYCQKKKIVCRNAYSSRRHTSSPGVITRQRATFLCTVCFIAVRFAQLDKCRSAGGEAPLNN